MLSVLPRCRLHGELWLMVVRIPEPVFAEMLLAESYYGKALGYEY